ncbi:LPXTG-site transpeptidase (sortase) family protein [Nocardia puris]|uniref:LPXTG-site transpeptidase (Sortase) family protein n=1 Tax=Nocardia puris TaxID=208602 RepID=A0A366DU86_9NOCA|nr:LPXTG-site transpeptidase (sortase) family protein [Nocardia puris]
MKTPRREHNPPPVEANQHTRSPIASAPEPATDPKHRFRVRASLTLLTIAATLFTASALTTAHQVSTPPNDGTGALSAPTPPAGALPRSTPTALSIPALDLSIPLDRVALRPDGTVADPARFDRPSWYESGATPGELGSAVILGHVDSYRGRAVFFRLGELRPGDTVRVDRADNTTAEFLVTRTETVPKNAFPNQAVYGFHGTADLQLVTCGGSFDPVRRAYRDNVIIYTTFTGTESSALAH